MVRVHGDLQEKHWLVGQRYYHVLYPYIFIRAHARGYRSGFKSFRALRNSSSMVGHLTQTFICHLSRASIVMTFSHDLEINLLSLHSTQHWAYVMLRGSMLISGIALPIPHNIYSTLASLLVFNHINGHGGKITRFGR